MPRFPDDVAAAFGGPRHGLDGLRRRVGAGRRALTCSALKPQGLPPAKLAELARRFADGGIDYIKDDHGLADQAYSPFAARVAAIAAALRGTAARYVPSVTGDLDAMRAQIASRARRRHRHRDGRADGRRASRISTGWSPTIPTWPSSRIRRSPARVAHRAAVPFRQAVPDAGRRRRRVPQSWRAVRLFAGDLPGRSPRRALDAARRPSSLRAGSGRRHEPRTGAARCLNSTAPTSCC